MKYKKVTLLFLTLYFFTLSFAYSQTWQLNDPKNMVYVDGSNGILGVGNQNPYSTFSFTGEFVIRNGQTQSYFYRGVDKEVSFIASTLSTNFDLTVYDAMRGRDIPVVSILNSSSPYHLYGIGIGTTHANADIDIQKDDVMLESGAYTSILQSSTGDITFNFPTDRKLELITTSDPDEFVKLSDDGLAINYSHSPELNTLAVKGNIEMNGSFVSNREHFSFKTLEFPVLDFIESPTTTRVASFYEKALFQKLKQSYSTTAIDGNYAFELDRQYDMFLGLDTRMIFRRKDIDNGYYTIQNSIIPKRNFEPGTTGWTEDPSVGIEVVDNFGNEQFVILDGGITCFGTCGD